MKVLDLHKWDVEINQAKHIQIQLSSQLIIDGEPDGNRLIAGADVSYSRIDKRVWAGVVVFDIQKWKTVEEQGCSGIVRFPYIPGYLSFREIPVLLEVFRRIDSYPDVVFLDGQGIAHPRKMGIASHVGLFLDRSTVGCAKKRLVGEFMPVGRERGSRSALRFNREQIGWVLRTKIGIKPVFVSPGHRIGLKACDRIVMDCCRQYRIPEPLRRAHLLVNQLRYQFCI